MEEYRPVVLEFAPSLRATTSQTDKLIITCRVTGCYYIPPKPRRRYWAEGKVNVSLSLAKKVRRAVW
jgi:hypothetical protein